MALQACNEGIKYIGLFAYGSGTFTSMDLRLYTNNYTPVKTSAFASFTEPTNSEYAPIAFSADDFAYALTGGKDLFTPPTKTFAFTSAVTVYGYFVTVLDYPNHFVMWAELIAGGPIVFGSAGGNILVVAQNEITSP